MLSIGAIGQNVTEFNVYTVKQKWFNDPFLNAIPRSVIVHTRVTFKFHHIHCKVFAMIVKLLPLMINYGVTMATMQSRCYFSITIHSNNAVNVMCICSYF